MKVKQSLEEMQVIFQKQWHNISKDNIEVGLVHGQMSDEEKNKIMTCI